MQDETEPREPLDVHDRMRMILIMMEGNPGALTVLKKLLGDGLTMQAENLMHVLDADDMNIRGSQLWVAYNDVCKMNIEVLKKKLRDRDPEMVAVINRECPECEPAVTGGASSARAGGR